MTKPKTPKQGDMTQNAGGSSIADQKSYNFLDQPSKNLLASNRAKQPDQYGAEKIAPKTK